MNLKKIKDSKDRTLKQLILDLKELGVVPRTILGDNGDNSEDVEYSVDEVGSIPNGEYSIDVIVDEDIKKGIKGLQFRYPDVYVVDNEDNWFLNVCVKNGKIVSYNELEED